MLRKFCANRSYLRPHRECSLFNFMNGHGKLDVKFFSGNAETESQNMDTSKAKNALGDCIEVNKSLEEKKKCDPRCFNIYIEST